LLPTQYSPLYSLAGAEGNWIGYSGNVGVSTADVIMQIDVTGSATCVVETSSDGRTWLPVGEYDASTFVVLDHHQAYYRAHVQEYESGQVTAIIGHGRGRENQLISVPRGPGEAEDEDVALGVSRTLAVLIGDSTAITNTVTETAFSKSYTLPAGKIDQAGAALRVTVGGKVSTTGNPDLTIRFRLGGTVFTGVTVANLGNPTNAIWQASGIIVARTTGGSAQVAGGGVYLNVPLVGNQAVVTYIAPTSKDLGAAQTVDVTAQWSAAAAGNTVTMTSLEVEALYPADTIA
jgi:hypothetical protein